MAADANSHGVPFYTGYKFTWGTNSHEVHIHLHIVQEKMSFQLA